MGTLYPFRCNKCGYQVTTSGGHDYGMMAVTDTYICKSCKAIVDVLVGKYGETFSKEDIQLKENNSESDLHYYVCPICHSDKQLEKWSKEERRCPRCEGKMGIISRVNFISWD